MSVKTAFLALLVSIAFAGGLSAATLDEPTYTGDVASILKQKCVGCHRPGEIAPMALRTYQEVRPWAKSIQRNVESKTMPPWHADPSVYAFRNDRSLSAAEIDTIVRWVETGAPQGDPSDSPTPPELPDSEWILGEPDFIAEFEAVTIPAGGPDQFHDLVAKVMLPEDKWIVAVEVMPGNRKVLHHVITMQFKGFDINPAEGWLGAWAAGTEPMIFPPGTGRFLPAGSNLIGDMHYHPADTEEVDRTRIGLHFGDKDEVQKELANLWIMNQGFKIPAGASNYEVRSSYTIWQDGKIMGLLPHMHYRGKDFTFTATYPDGRQEVLLSVPRYDFNWQTNYILDEPINVPAGTVIDCVAHFDNSTDNPVNPDPTKDITFGPESYDEMMIGFLDFVVDEGVSMMPLSEIRRSKLPVLASQYPGEVYAVTAGDPEFLAPLYLPREGEGIFFVIYNGTLVKARVSEITWTGDEFAASVESPNGPVPLTGKLGADGAIETQLGETSFNGSIFDGSTAAATSSSGP